MQDGDIICTYLVRYEVWHGGKILVEQLVLTLRVGNPMLEKQWKHLMFPHTNCR